MDIKRLAKEIHQVNIKKGFWKKKGNEGQRLFLVITEFAEVCEADRKGRNGSIKSFEANMDMQSKFTYPKKQALEIKKDIFEKHIKDSIGDELADSFIRMLDYCIGFKVKISEKRVASYLEGNERYMLKNLGKELLKLSGHVRDILVKDKKMMCDYIISRIIWIANEKSIDLEKHVKYKMWYNSTRPKKHGKRY